MKLVPPKPTPSERKFDRTREEAFSNEGAPPPHRQSPRAANADAFVDNEVVAVEPAVPVAPADAPRSMGRPSAKPDEDVGAAQTPPRS